MMPRLFRRIRPIPRLLKRQILMGMFAISLLLSLSTGLPQAPSGNSNAIAIEPSSPHQPSDHQASARELVGQGVDRYRAGDLQGAIAPWTTALEQYQASGELSPQGIVLENLARAYGNLGRADDALPYWSEAIVIQQQLGNSQKIGRLLTEQAQTYSRLGQYRQAVARLCSEVRYVVGSDGVESDAIGSGGGETRLTEEIRCGIGSAVGIAQVGGDRQGEAAAWGSFGEVLRLQGQYDRADIALNQSLTLAQSLQNDLYIATASQSLTNLFMQRATISDRRAQDARQRGDDRAAIPQEEAALDYTKTALGYAQQSLAANSTDQSTTATRRRVQGLLAMTTLHHRLGELSAAQRSHGEAIAFLDTLPDSRTKAYLTIDLATALPLTQSLEAGSPRRSRVTCGNSDGLDAIIQRQEGLLIRASTMAERLQDYRAQSFALGTLGHLYECQQDYNRALRTTHRAEWAADQDLKSPDSLYLWQWQMGRILKQQGDRPGAIATYEKSVNTLEKIRSGILTANRDIQFDFRDAVEPVYRELAALRLDDAPTSTLVSRDDTATTENINAALIAIDSLKLAELQNYFGDECLILASIAPEDVQGAVKGVGAGSSSSATTGVFSTFIDVNRTAIVLTLPDGQQRVEWLALGEAELQQQVTQFRIDLQNSLNRLRQYDPSVAMPLYDHLIRPFIPDLEQAGIKTLVFVQDGLLRSVPMGALYDGEQYLIEQYAIATTPSLSLNALTPTTQRSSRRSDVPKVLGLGLTKQSFVKGRYWPALSGVRQELEQITNQLPGSRQFLNETFTRDRLRQALQEDDYSVIHMATHGEFGAEPQNTFLITGDEQALTIGELESAIRASNTASNIELLALTACKTAVGDNRSTLGLAGVAVQAGVRSAIASLWSINDSSTAELMTTFYQALTTPGISKAQALQTAQLSLLKREDVFNRPGFWAPFVLVGDWQ